ncbi:MAG: Lrp/AsnC family transcriptional regulator [Sphingobacteriaceae bacterium]|nr:Lrp/AsnC family transcriptional regulator [Sphingobacteriaceae bacterium]
MLLLKKLNSANSYFCMVMAIELNKTDFQILKILQENGRITNLQLSTEIGLSPAPTLERVRKLENAGYIKSYHALVDEELLGLGIKTFIQIQLDFHKNNTIQTFVDEVRQIKEITECHHVTGQCDFLLKVYVKDIKAYERLIMDKISKISVVKTFQTMMIMSTSKKEPSVPLEY